jgi:hypothetical protein
LRVSALRQQPQITRSLRRLRRVSAEPGAENSKGARIDGGDALGAYTAV